MKKSEKAKLRKLIIEYGDERALLGKHKTPFNILAAKHAKNRVYKYIREIEEPTPTCRIVL